MEQILNILEQQKNWKEFIKKSCRKNNISVEIAGFFTPIKIRALYQRLLKNYQTKLDDDSICWAQNQLKALHWLLVVMSGIKERLIQDFTLEDWNIFLLIFLNKDLSILKYESIKLVNQRATKNRNWAQQQTQLLTLIIRQNHQNNKWNDIARKLYKKSQNQFFRSGKQCRERWLNHLDPNKKKGQWEQDEDRVIIKQILNHGRRWSHIAKELGNYRTEHMVKNRFKTLLIRQKKLTPKISRQNVLLKEIGIRLFGDESLFLQKRNSLKQQKLMDGQKMNLQKQQNPKITSKKQLSRTEVLIPQLQEQKHVNSQNLDIQVSLDVKDLEKLVNDPILPQIMDDCGIGAIPTSMSNYQMQQIYSPYYLNYTGVTPYLSPSPSLSYFVNPSFTAFDNAFNQKMFICPTFTNTPNDNTNFNQ